MKKCLNVNELVEELIVLRDCINDYLGQSIAYIRKDEDVTDTGVYLEFHDKPDYHVYIDIHKPVVTYVKDGVFGQCQLEQFGFNEASGFLGVEVYPENKASRFGIDVSKMRNKRTKKNKRS